MGRCVPSCLWTAVYIYTCILVSNLIMEIAARDIYNFKSHSLMNTLTCTSQVPGTN